MLEEKIDKINTIPSDIYNYGFIDWGFRIFTGSIVLTQRHPISHYEKYPH